MVGLNDQGALEFVVGRAVADDGPAAAVGAIIERCEEAATWTRAVAARVIRDGGAALVIDYGHKATATGDTLQAVRRHAYHSVLSAPGEADLTAHVDFEAIGAAAVAAGANVFGPIEQGLWLRRLGIQMRQAQLCAGKSEVVAREIAAGIRRLITPDGMGALFKVLAFAHPSVASLEGFAQDTIDDHR
jgi:SAM-dependent MidA family methyltransferase